MTGMQQCQMPDINLIRDESCPRPTGFSTWQRNAWQDACVMVVWPKLRNPYKPWHLYVSDMDVVIYGVVNCVRQVALGIFV